MTQEELIQYLKENLKVKVSRYTEDYRKVLKVSLILDKHVIDYDTVYLGD